MKPYHTPNMASFKAGEDLSAKQYHFVKAGPNENEVQACDSDGEKAVGILMNDPKDGETADVAVPGGGAKLKVDASVSPAALIKTGADGKGETADNAGDHINAIADSTSGASSADDVIPVFVAPAINYGVTATGGVLSNDTVGTTTEDGTLEFQVGGSTVKVPYWSDD